MTTSDIDVFEINESFASVALSRDSIIKPAFDR
jgi:acetyl-CoA acetyltransferase